MKQKRKKSLIRLLVEFVKLQLAGNILFWGTYIGFFILDTVYGWPDLQALATASIVAHIIYFFADREWVFADDSGRRKTSDEIVRFIIFMTLNYFLNIGIITWLESYAHISPYIGQFLSGFFFTAWSYVGLKFWVFDVPKPQAITIKVKRRKMDNVRRSRRKAAK